MNLQSILILAVILVLALFIVLRSYRKSRRRNFHCADCKEENCALRDILIQRAAKGKKSKTNS